MHKTKTGRWQPDPEPKPPPPEDGPFGLDGELRLPPPMPWWFPLMHFEAAVGREALRG